MNRQVCRQFASGNCRYGSHCKFIHQLPQQQQQPQTSFGSAGGRGGQRPHGGQQASQNFGSSNRFSVFNSGGRGSPQQGQPPPPPPKEHKCGDPQACRNVIREDQKLEWPTFWGATSYAHYKHLPNDVAGDVSPEELRHAAYQAVSRGQALPAIIQSEQSLFSARAAAFSNLLNNPYTGAASSSSPSVSQFPPTPPAPGTILLFGKPVAPANPSMTSAPFGTQGSVSGPWPSIPNPVLSPAPLSSGPMPSLHVGGFGVVSSAPPHSFGVSPPVSSATIFSQPAQLRQPPSVFPVPTGSQSGSAPPPPFGGSPGGQPQHSAASPFGGAFAAPAASAAQPTTSQHAVSVCGTLGPSPPSSAAAGGHEWVADRWSLGQIPEDEPPTFAR